MSYSQIDFLDTTVKFGSDRGLITTLYNKPTDTQLYLEHSSAHPQNIFTKGSYGQYLRIRKICSLASDFETNAKKTYWILPEKGISIFQLKETLPQGQKILTG